MIRIKDLMKKVGLSKRDINALVRKGKFPEPYTQGEYPMWSVIEVDRWMLGDWYGR